MTQEEIESKLINLYESNKDKVCERIEKIFQTNLEVESIFNEFIWLDSSEIEQIYSYIWDNSEDFITHLESFPASDKTLCMINYSTNGFIEADVIQIIFSDKFIKVVKEIINERNLNYELRNFGF